MVGVVMYMLLFVNIDNAGNITEALYGVNIIPDKEYDFFFIASEEVATNSHLYKVVLNGFKSELQLR
jgi:hypothetical protein